MAESTTYERGLVELIETAFRRRMPALIPFSLQNQTVIKLIRHLKRHATGSPATVYQYVYGIWRFRLWTNAQPDNTLRECWSPQGDVLPRILVKHAQLVDDFVGHLQEQNLAPGTIANHAKAVKRLYGTNGLQLQLPRYPRTVLYPDRSPTPEELEKVLAVADLREKLILSTLALSGLRERTVCELTYGHVKENLERNVIPVLVRIEPSITKGMYTGYWTFLGAEAAEYLKFYLEERRKGSDKFPPERIRDDSPLIRDSRDAGEVKPISPSAVWWTVHQLYIRAGLITRCDRYRDHRKGSACDLCGWPKQTKRRHDLRVHSLRYYFRTQLTARGVSPEYSEFMMGHKRASYNDVRSKGVEFLRNIYRASDLSIRQPSKASRLDVLKELVRSFGYDPERVLLREAFTEPHRMVVSQAERDELDIRTLARTIRESLVSEVAGIKSQATETFESSLESPPGYHVATTTLHF